MSSAGMIAVTRRKFLGFGTLGLAASSALFSSCAPKVEPPLRIGAVPWPGYECLFLARALGFWEDEPIKLVDYPTAPEAVRAFRNGALEAVALTGDEFLRLAVEEPSVRALLVADFSNGADAMIAQPEFDCVRKLEGRRVGVEVNATGVFLLTRALDAVGMTARDIQIVPLDNDQHAAAFEQRRIDAVVTFEPTRTRILRKSGRVLFDSARIPGEISDLLVARESTINGRLDRFRSVAKTWFQAREFLFSHQERAAALIAPHLHLSPREVIETLNLIAIPSREENRRYLSAEDGDLLLGLRKTHRVLREAGHFPAALPSLGLLDGRALS